MRSQEDPKWDAWFSWQKGMWTESVIYPCLNVSVVISFGSSHHMCSTRKAVLNNFSILTGKHLCWNLFLIKLKACNFIRKRLQRKFFHVNIVKFLRTHNLQNICKRLLEFVVNDDYCSKPTKKLHLIGHNVFDIEISTNRKQKMC